MVRRGWRRPTSSPWGLLILFTPSFVWKEIALISFPRPSPYFSPIFILGVFFTYKQPWFQSSRLSSFYSPGLGEILIQAHTRSGALLPVRHLQGLVIRTTAAAKSLQSYPTLCNPIDGSPPGSAVPGILQARTLEWVAISFSNAWKWKVKVKSLSRVQLFTTPWIAAYQAPPSMGISRQEYWSGVPLPSPNKDDTWS